MKAKYEISVWSDIYDEDLGRFREQKEIVIGSDTMTSEARARSPKLVTNINGTNQFTFDMYYRYIDTQSGVEIENPYIKYLVNERKIKVHWKDKWYDLLIKSIKENQSGRVISYTCEDCYITELSRTGFELEFATELQNNIGTAKELVEKVIENTDWQYDEQNSDTIYQLTEEAVYEVELLNTFENVEKCPTGNGTLTAHKIALLYYSFAPSAELKLLKNNIQLCYTDGQWEFDENDMLVTNGNCYNLEVTWTLPENSHIATAWYNETKLFALDFNIGVSKQFRAKRYVQSQTTEYCKILNRYVNVYTSNTEVDENNEPKIVYGYSTTEYNDALAVVNLVTNPSNFKNTQGWRRADDTKLYFKLSPSFNQNTDVSSYKTTSYLYLPSGYTFNNGILNNKTYISKGFSIGEKYILRVKLKPGVNEPGEADQDYVNVTTNNTFIPSIQSRNSNYEPTGVHYFQLDHSEYVDGWNEYTMNCIHSCAYDKISDSSNCFGIFLHLLDGIYYWLEDIQFYRETYGMNGSGVPQRIDPNQMSIQSMSQQYWRYFWKEQNPSVTKDTLDYIYTSLTEWEDVTPQYNNYQRYGTIEADNSNRFNILQDIAEAFKCWVRFDVQHDEDTGYIKYENNQPQKFIQLKTEAGQETGIGFIYGIDLKDITRNIKSNQIATKTIVEQNDNEFGKNGFCSIARSEQNYARENFIYNFDYYIQQGLLDKNILYNDLYGVRGYYALLNTWNLEYAENLEFITNKKLEQTKQKATATVYEQYISASQEELNSIAESLIKLASTEDHIDPDDPDKPFKDALEYAKDHYKNTKVQSLVNDYSSVKNTKEIYDSLYTDITASLATLDSDITAKTARQNQIIDDLRTINKWFYIKYSRFIQEGSWTSEDYWDDDLYYLDALQVAYESARPQVSYEINVLRLSDIEDYASKIFNLGDISFIQDVEYFGYQDDKITPYKEKVVLTEITSYFDTPDKDVIKVQNYKTQFDDLFQRITASVQNLEFTEGKYAKAASIMATDGTIRSSVIQNTFNQNKDLVYGAQNESATIDNTGITVTDNGDAAKQVKVTSGGIFITDDGGATWNNAIRGDGISADTVTTGNLNTDAVTIYGSDSPSFTWDAHGINAYMLDEGGHVEAYVEASNVTESNFNNNVYYIYNTTDQKYEIADKYVSGAHYYVLKDFESTYNEVGTLTREEFNNNIYYILDPETNKHILATEWNESTIYYEPTRSTNYSQFVRFDKYGLYGIKGKNNYQPTSENQIYHDANFGLTWNKFFMRSANGEKSVEISTDRDIVIHDGYYDRVVIGRMNGALEDGYGIRIRDNEGNIIFECGELDDGAGHNIQSRATIAGWQFTKDELASSLEGQAIRIKADGNIGCYGSAATSYDDFVYELHPSNTFSFAVAPLNPNKYKNHIGPTRTFNSNDTIWPFVSMIGATKKIKMEQGPVHDHWNDAQYSSDFIAWPNGARQVSNVTLQIAAPDGSDRYYNYTLDNLIFNYKVNTTASTYDHQNKDEEHGYIEKTTYNYCFDIDVTDVQGHPLFTIPYQSDFSITKNKFIPASDTTWLISKNGDAIFHNIKADGGTIAGWFIDNEKIYQTTNNQPDGPIKTQLNSGGVQIGSDYYSIITDAINAAMATLGGVILNNGTVNGYNIKSISDTANAAYYIASQAQDNANYAIGLADGAIDDAAEALGVAGQAIDLAGEAYNHLPAHSHLSGSLVAGSVPVTGNTGGIAG